VVGAKGSGKTSLVNTILGRRQLPPGKRTTCCEVHRGGGGGGVLGRDVTVVDTPGWWTNYFASESAAFDRREMALAARGLVVPCSPVHALLLVVRVDRAFGRTYRRATREHMELLLGPGVWRHTLLVFTFGDWLGDTGVERYVESEGAALRWLVDRCGNRYHVMHNKSQGGGEGREGGEAGGGSFQVAELLTKVEEMVAANGGALLHPAGGGASDDGGAMEEQQHLEEQQQQRWRAEEERRAGQRRLAKSRQRQTRRSLLGEGDKRPSYFVPVCVADRISQPLKTFNRFVVHLI